MERAEEACAFAPLLGVELHAIELGHVEPDELAGNAAIVGINGLRGDHMRHGLAFDLAVPAAVRDRGLDSDGIILKSRQHRGELARGLGYAVAVRDAPLRRADRTRRHDDAGDGEDDRPRDDAAAHPVRERDGLAVFLRCDDAVAVEVALERHAQDEQHRLGRKRDKDHVDAELVERGEKKRPVGNGDAVARGAKRRHEGRRHRDAGDERGGLLVARVAQAAREASGEGDDEIPDRGRGVVDDGRRGGGERRELEVERRGKQAERHLQGEARDGLDGDLAVERGDTVGHGEDRAHERTDEHGAHDGDVGVDVEPDARDEHRDDQDAEVRAGEARPADKAPPDHAVGGTTLADVEGALEKADGAVEDVAQGGAEVAVVLPPVLG